MGKIEREEMDDEIVEDFAHHHVRMEKSNPQVLKKMVNISNDIVEQLSSEGMNATDIAFIMIEIVRQSAKKREKESFDMAFA